MPSASLGPTMAVTVDTIKTQFPEFASLDATTITRWLELAETNHNADCWGGKSDDGLAWLTAHFLQAFAIENACGQTPGPGPLTGTTEGSVSASWSPLTIPTIFRKNDLATTVYGRRYLSMADTVFCCRCT